MIKIELVINIHELLLEKENLYPTPILQATAHIESLISNHPFLDGNKRIGYVMMRSFLLQNNIDL